MFLGRKYKNFIVKNMSTLSEEDSVLFVKCDEISSSVEKKLKGMLHNIGVSSIKDIKYQEDMVGEMGIPIALSKYKDRMSRDKRIAVAIRGRSSAPMLYLVTKENGVVKKA